MTNWVDVQALAPRVLGKAVSGMAVKELKFIENLRNYEKALVHY